MEVREELLLIIYVVSVFEGLVVLHSVVVVGVSACFHSIISLRLQEICFFILPIKVETGAKIYSCLTFLISLQIVAASSLWLASKLEESPRRARQVIIVFHRMEYRRENLPIEHLNLYSKVRLISSYVLTKFGTYFSKQIIQALFLVTVSYFLFAICILQKFRLESRIEPNRKTHIERDGLCLSC